MAYNIIGQLDVTGLPNIDKVIPRCVVVDIPAGASPKDVIVQLPGPEGVRVPARWYGAPSIAVDDFVRVQQRGIDGLYDIIGTDGDTAWDAGGAPTDAQYVVLAPDGTLTDERVLIEGQGIGFADGGPGGNLEVSLAIDGLDEDTTAADGDYLAIYTDGANKKQSRANFLLADIATNLVTSGWYDYALVDSANASGVASHFRDNDSSYPDGWTETDAAQVTNTNRKYSFWYLKGNSADTLWKYRIKSAVNLESTTVSSFNSFMLGPIVIRQAAYTADWSFRFGLYRDNAGTIDENTYIRALVYWNSGASSWQIQGEESDGSTPHTGTVYTLNQVPIVQPFYLRVLVHNVAAKTARAYVGIAPIGESHLLLLSQAPSVAPTWGDMWVQIHRDRGAGVDDYVFLGALDYLFQVA
jgi:hypothetical protein